MTTPTYSGTTTWLSTGVQICNRAAAKLLIIDTSNGESLPAQRLSDFLYQLNAITKETLAVPGVIPWTTARNTLFLQQGQGSPGNPYYLGSTTGFQSQAMWTSTYVSTTLTAAANTGANTITVASISGISSGDHIGIKLTSGATFWTTVNGAPLGSTVTLSSNLSGPAALGNFVYDFTSYADRPQRILQVARSNTSNIDNIIDPISLQVLNQLPNKQENGIPLQYAFSATIPNATLYIWQPYDGISGWDRLSCWCDTIIEDFDSAGADTPYFPVEWTNYLIWQLAAEMGEEFPIADTKIQRLYQTATTKLGRLLDYSSTLSGSPIQFGLEQNAWGQKRE